MNVLCLSDLHGQLPDPRTLPPSDVVIISGDVCPDTQYTWRATVSGIAGVAEACARLQAHWLSSVFAAWARLVDRPIIMTWGNHDFIGDCPVPYGVPDNVHILTEAFPRYEHGGEVFYALPHCDLPRWAMYRSPETFRDAIEDIPEDVTILITHRPPAVVGSAQVPIVGGEAEDLGSLTLYTKTRELPHLKLHVFGHIHFGRGVVVQDSVTYVNAAYLNEDYQPWGDAPFIIEV